MQVLLAKGRGRETQPWQPAGSVNSTFMWRSGLVHDEASIKGLRELFNGALSM